MYKEVWNKYVKGFKFLLPFILLKVLFECISVNWAGEEYDFFGGNLSTFKEAVVNNFGEYLFIIFVGSLFYSFLMVVIKALINEEDVNYRENFKEGLSLYLRYVALSIIIYAIYTVVLFLSSFRILLPIAFILFIYINPVFIPCDAYLVYYNTSAMEALRKGMDLGKKYFVEILLLVIILGTVWGISMKLIINPIGYVCKEFIGTSMGTYLCMFTMAICKKEGKIEEMLEG